MKAYSTHARGAAPMRRRGQARAEAVGARKAARAGTGAPADAVRALADHTGVRADAWAYSEASADAVKALADRMGIPVSAWPISGMRDEAEWEARAEMHAREDERMDHLDKALREEEGRNGESQRAAELRAELNSGERARSLARRAIHEKVVRAERDESRRGELFAAVRGMLVQSIHHCDEAERVVRMVTVLLDAGRSLSTGEESDRERGRWGEGATEGALYAAQYAGVVDRDMYGVLSLARPVDTGSPVGEEWMYGALERAVRLGAARYTDAGIEVSEGAGALTPHELAGAEAVAAGVNAYGEPPGLGRWLRENARDGMGITWAEATVNARGADAEVGEAYGRLVAQGRAPPAGPHEARH